MRKSILVSIILIAMLLSTNHAYGLTASEFVAKYDNKFSEGKWVTVLVKLSGEPKTDDPTIRAKEIRYLQTSVLKFVHFAAAKNVISDTWNNEFTAYMTTSLADAVSKRSDVISVTILDDTSGKKFGKTCMTFRPRTDLSGCDLHGMNLEGANLRGANLQRADLSGANLRHAILSYVSLDFANLTDADLTSAKLIAADVRHADLSGAVLYRATMLSADFTSSNLSNADLRYSILTNAVLSFVNLEGANLEGAGTWRTNLNHCYGHEICN